MRYQALLPVIARNQMPQSRSNSSVDGGERHALGLKNGHRVVVAIVENAHIRVTRVAHQDERRVPSGARPNHCVALPRRAEIARAPDTQLLTKEVERGVGVAEIELFRARVVHERAFAASDRLRNLLYFPAWAPSFVTVLRQEIPRKDMLCSW